jgi:4'-phosphopantetheinyl transferase
MAEVPPADNDAWLAPGERAALGRMRIEKRHREYRLGRWTAKRLLAACLGAPAPDELGALAAIEIRAAEDGAPEVYLGGAPAAIDQPLRGAGARVRGGGGAVLRLRSGGDRAAQP